MELSSGTSIDTNVVLTARCLENIRARWAGCPRNELVYVGVASFRGLGLAGGMAEE